MSEDIQRDVPPPAEIRPPGTPPDYLGLDYEEEPPFPRTITVAGSLLIVFGSLVLLYQAINLAFAFAFAGNMGGQPGGAAFAGGVCGILFLVLMGAVFILEGVRAVRGTLRDTLGPGIASMTLAVLVFAATAIGALVGNAFQAGLRGLVGAMLFAASVLALVGRSQYRLWRKVQKARREGQWPGETGA